MQPQQADNPVTQHQFMSIYTIISQLLTLAILSSASNWAILPAPSMALGPEELAPFTAGLCAISSLWKQHITLPKHPWPQLTMDIWLRRKWGNIYDSCQHRCKALQKPTACTKCCQLYLHSTVSNVFFDKPQVTELWVELLIFLEHIFLHYFCCCLLSFQFTVQSFIFDTHGAVSLALWSLSPVELIAPVQWPQMWQLSGLVSGWHSCLHHQPPAQVNQFPSLCPFVSALVISGEKSCTNCDHHKPWLIEWSSLVWVWRVPAHVQYSAAHTSCWTHIPYWPIWAETNRGTIWSAGETVKCFPSSKLARKG